MDRAIEMIPLEKLKPFPGNPKDISEQEKLKLANQIKKHGLLKALSVWKKGRSYVVLDGNQRLEVLKEIFGPTTEVPCEPVEVKDDQDAADKCLVLVGQYGRLNKSKLKKFVGKAGYESVEAAQQVFSFVEMDGEEAKGAEEEGEEKEAPDPTPWDKIVYVGCPNCETQFPQKDHKCKPAEVEQGKIWKEASE